MHRWLRNTHLALGLMCAPFVLMYGASSVQMAHRTWFSQRPRITTASVTVPPGDAADARSLARSLMDRGAVAGEVTQAAAKPFGFQVRLVRPGTVQDVKYDRQSGTAEIRTARSSFIMLLNRLHHLAGVRHGDLAVNLWGAALALVSLMLIALAATGIYLWFQMHQERRAGSVILAASLAFSVGLMVLMRLA